MSPFLLDVKNNSEHILTSLAQTCYWHLGRKVQVQDSQYVKKETVTFLVGKVQYLRFLIRLNFFHQFAIPSFTVCSRLFPHLGIRLLLFSLLTTFF